VVSNSASLKINKKGNSSFKISSDYSFQTLDGEETVNRVM